MSETPATPRAVRSFVRREGRMTSAQRRALEALADTYRWPFETCVPESITGRCAPLWLEVGCGDGENVLAAARAHPARDYLACEVHGPGVGHLLNGIAQARLTNLRVARCDVFELLKVLPAESLAAASVFFPDPWPKKRHHKRRLLQLPFAALLASRLAPGGYFHVATDWQEYAEHILATLGAVDDLENPHPGFAARPADRPETKFESRGRRLGHGSWDTIFRKRTPHPGGHP